MALHTLQSWYIAVCNYGFECLFKIEVDLVDVTERSASELVEIKSTTTFKAEFSRHLGNVGDALGIPEEGRGVVMRSDTSHIVNGIKYWSAHDWLMR